MSATGTGLLCSSADLQERLAELRVTLQNEQRRAALDMLHAFSSRRVKPDSRR